MAKKRCWFGWVRRLFISEAKPKPKAEKKSRKCRWVLGSLKFRQCPALPAPHKTINEATEKHRKYALTVALATAAAAEAAVAAAQAAAEVVRLTSSEYSHHFIQGNENLAAIKIQSAFRAFLARKAFRALKALVRLQAIARGRAVRRKTCIKLKCIPSNGKKQSEVQAKIAKFEGISKFSDYKQLSTFEELEEKEHKGKNQRRDFQLIHMLGCNGQTNWDYSMLSKQDMEAQWIRKQEANIKRERMMKYSFSQRERRNAQIPEEWLRSKGSGRYSQCMESGANKEAHHQEAMENLKPIAISKRFTGDVLGASQVKTKTPRKQDFEDGNSPALSFPRRSFGHLRWSAITDESSAPNSPVFPTYMAATLSAKAKTRSMSTPKQRVAFEDTFFDRSFSYKNKPNLWSSYNGELFGTKVKNGASNF